MKQNYVTLNDGNHIPQFGLGVYLIRGDEPTCEVCCGQVSMLDYYTERCITC